MRDLILPADRYLASLLGITDEQFAAFRAAARKRAREQPAPAAIAGLETTLLAISLASSLLSVGFSIAAQFFKPKPSQPPRLVQRDRSLADINQNQRFSPRYGIDAAQEVIGLGATIPVIYALRETLDGETFGGVRVNTPVVWNQIWSLGGSQMLRAMFMLGEATINSIDPTNFAIGNNSLAVYDLLSAAANERASRITIYYRREGGRIQSSNRVAGRTASLDLGNAVNQGANDVFEVRSLGNNYAPAFCSVNRPSTGTSFGLYAPCGNNLGYKLTPQVRPATRVRLKPRGSKGNAEIACDPDPSALVQRLKHQAFFSSRSGFTTGGNTVDVDDVIEYRLDRTAEPLDDPFLVDVDEGVVGAWSSSLVVEVAPPVYRANEEQTTIAVQWGDSDLAFVSNPSVSSGGQDLEVTFTLNYGGSTLPNGDSLLERLEDAAFGQYTVRYAVRVSRGDEQIESFVDVLITKQSRRELLATSNVTSTNPVAVETTISDAGDSNFYSIGLDLDDDSGPAELLTGPKRIRAKIIIPIEELDAASETAADAASAIANRQKTWEGAIQVGELYKVGSALAVCTSKSPDDAVFSSDADQPAVDSGTTIFATFRVVRAGQMASYPLSELRRNGKDSTTGLTATAAPHLMRCAIATFSTSRRCRVVEIGIRSSLGIRINGLTNFRDCPTYQEIDGRACLFKEGDTVKRGKRVITEDYRSNQINLSEDRYSFNRLLFRDADSSSEFTPLAPCFGMRGLTQQNSYNYIRLVMPAEGHWVFRLEPLSGWEIRSGAAAGELVLLDAGMSSTISDASAGVAWYSNGIRASTSDKLARNQATFGLTSTRRASNIDSTLPRIDGDNYVDAWGKLAEFFVYDGIDSTAAAGPEHEVVYLNEILPNATAPQYNNLALLGVNVSSSSEWQQFSQFSVYVTGGVRCRRLLQDLTDGPTHLFPDILLDLLTNDRYGRGDSITDNLIDLDSFRAAAQWCQGRRYFWDGVVADRLNLREWAADVAAAHLLIFGESDGRFYLRQAMPTTPVEIRAQFTAGNIAVGTFQLQYLDPEDREPIQVSVKYREERANNEIGNPGVFPVERELLIREAGSSDTDPVEPLNLTAYVTNRKHAVDAAKFIIRMRRIPTHKIRFTTTQEGVLANLAPSDYIKVAMDVTQYDEFNNGVVTADGNVVATRALGPGSYPVFGWDGRNEAAPAPMTLTVGSDGLAQPRGILFTVTPQTVQKRTYQIEKITPDGGAFTIEAVHMPTTDAGILEIAADFDDPTRWVIQG